jgi:hypothetical protein
MNGTTRILLGICLVATNLTASAQNFAIDWFIINSGGGDSSGGSYAVSGTLGQPATGLSSGGSYTLEGGFWAGESIDDPNIHIAHASATTVRVWWPSPSTGFVLQVNTSPNNPSGWGNMPAGTVVADDGTTRSVTVSSVQGSRFYRLRQN